MGYRCHQRPHRRRPGHGVHRGRPLHPGVHRHPRRRQGNSLRGPGTTPPGRAGALRRLLPGGGPWAHPTARQRQPVLGSRCFQDELRFLGIASSPAYVREPEGNGVSERFIRTLKEQLLWVHRFATVADLLDGLHTFKTAYNTPAEARLALTAEQVA
ncbi:MAG: integrase core domain-containing protein [Candidatus Dormibacteria bacterium]